jgi:hypothetical protein
MESALGSAIRESFDASVSGVLGVGGYPGDLQGAGVRPGSVSVAVGDQGRTVGDHRVKSKHIRTTPLKPCLRPSSADDPRFIPMFRRVAAHKLESVCSVVTIAESKPQLLKATCSYVYVGVGETGGE